MCCFIQFLMCFLLLVSVVVLVDDFSCKQCKLLEEIQIVYGVIICWGSMDDVIGYFDFKLCKEKLLIEFEFNCYVQLCVLFYCECSSVLLDGGLVECWVEIGVINQNIQVECMVVVVECWCWDLEVKCWWQIVGLLDLWKGQ